MNYISLVFAAILGAIISYLNFLISKSFLKKSINKYFFSSTIRIIICVAYLVLLYFLGESFAALDSKMLVLGGAIGVTLPSFFFTAKLLSSSKNSGGDDNNG